MYIKTRDSLDSFKLEMSYDEEHKQINTTIIINDKPVKHFTDVYELFTNFNKSHSFEKETYESWKGVKSKGVFSDFYPFTCSCGVSGCAGIWDGIYQKVRGWTIEWRIIDKDKNGYHFLDKSYYNFHKMQYNHEIVNAWKWLHDNKYLVIDMYGCYEETISDRLDSICEFYPEQVKLLNK
ncbi:hypothetical protein VPHG_00049 [Vibrio phage 11895-B1]|uniref:hypothetical protein n=1 Tax=Vibrio phage 11895-B1 TaxID=754075 RepID=UPI0002C0EA4F|nr:hypothetical protein VPHG_00049 [Vibrio phage 11895-B1]AGH32116.1 hypothetical protein VPHG_00049 [Vibrio phage 11895-B1]